jgi:hypothetical protein
MTWHDHLLMLLHLGAEVEHSLMVQYLYAAYSIGGNQIPDEHRTMVEGWRDAILSVAREEMGHLLTVQNLLVFLGGSVNFAREDFPWDREVYPFPFSLEPFSIKSLSCYIYAEMPRSVTPEPTPPPRKRREPNYVVPSAEAQARTINQVVASLGDWLDPETVRTGMHRVGELYEHIIEVISDEAKIADTAFDESSYEIQASWDEWGRGYRPSPKMLDSEGNLISHAATVLAADRPAHVLVDRVASRTDAIKALRALADQGEGPHTNRSHEPSHFERFLDIFQELLRHGDPSWKPARDIPRDPTTRLDFARAVRGPLPVTAPQSRATVQRSDPEASIIDAITAKHLAQIFNERYRLLLDYLAHTFRLARTTRRDRPGLRSMVMHRAFGEMYNLKTIAGLLVRLPRRDDGVSGYAGPPFEMPYSLNLPQGDIDIWRRHDDLLKSSQTTCRRLLYYAGNDPKVKAQLAEVGGEAYVRTLMDLDRQARNWIAQIISGAG